jgi:hypothetical protein
LSEESGYGEKKYRRDFTDAAEINALSEENEYSEKKHRRNFTGAAAIVATVIAFTTVIIAASGLFSWGGKLFSSTSAGTYKAYYVVKYTGYKDFALVRQAAELVKTSGGAGYIYKTADGYDIALAIYLTREDAETVVAKNAEATVQEAICGYDLSALAKDDRNALVDALEYAPLAIETLCDISMRLDKDELSVSAANGEIKALGMQLADIKHTFDEKTFSEAGTQATAVKLRLIAALGAIDNLSPAPVGRKMYAADIRYYAIFILAEYTALLNTF